MNLQEMYKDKKIIKTKIKKQFKKVWRSKLKLTDL